jgi:hypothetical protein
MSSRFISHFCAHKEIASRVLKNLCTHAPRFRGWICWHMSKMSVMTHSYTDVWPSPLMVSTSNVVSPCIQYLWLEWTSLQFPVRYTLRPMKQLSIEFVLHWTECVVCEAETGAVETVEHRACKGSVAKPGGNLIAMAVLRVTGICLVGVC